MSRDDCLETLLNFAKEQLNFAHEDIADVYSSVNEFDEELYQACRNYIEAYEFVDTLMSIFDASVSEILEDLKEDDGEEEKTHTIVRTEIKDDEEEEKPHAIIRTEISYSDVDEDGNEEWHVLNLTDDEKKILLSLIHKDKLGDAAHFLDKMTREKQDRRLEGLLSDEE